MKKEVFEFIDNLNRFSSNEHYLFVSDVEDTSAHFGTIKSSSLKGYWVIVYSDNLEYVTVETTLPTTLLSLRDGRYIICININ